MGNIIKNSDDDKDVEIVNQDTADTLSEEEDLEFIQGKTVRFVVGLEKANLYDTLLIRHQGATIQFGSNLDL
tara:strand:- start:379 stop:594 length:216 start_codon:yes stop_codon:yes gene_type:complete